MEYKNKTIQEGEKKTQKTYPFIVFSLRMLCICLARRKAVQCILLSLSGFCQLVFPDAALAEADREGLHDRPSQPPALQLLIRETKLCASLWDLGKTPGQRC